MKGRLLQSLGVVLVSCWAIFAQADEPTTVIETQRILLADVAPEVPESLAGIDLGPAAPPGRSRYISKKEIALKLRSAGIPASTLELPDGVRVESKARQYTTAELLALVQESIRAELPGDSSLIEARVFHPQTLSPVIQVGKVHLPRFLMRKGKQRQTATVEIMWGDQLAVRLPVQIEVELGEQVLSQVVKRGASVTLSIRKGQVEITTLAHTLSTGRVGDVISVRVPVTNKVVNARIVSADKVELQI